MAMDQAMLEYAASSQQVILRIYEWSRPTVSLGYFQSWERFSEQSELQSLDVVRRMTGGGAILHDREWTYSLAIPGDLERKGHSEQLYRSVHHAVVAWLRELGYAANFWEELNQKSGTTYLKSDPFFCFERRTQVDIVVGERKIMGSAQRRSAHGLLQHGSLLIDTSPATPHLPGLLSVDTSEKPNHRYYFANPARLGEVVKIGLQLGLNCRWTNGKANEAIIERAKAEAEARFASPGWTRSKNR